MELLAPGARPIAHQPLVWLNLLCLDAPLVAVGWLWLFAGSFSIPLAGQNCAALFLTTWWIYLTDRFADAVHLRPDFPKSLRQRVCLDHPKLWGSLILILGMMDAAVILRFLDPATILRGSVVGTLTLCYLATNWGFSALWRRFPLKEFVIGALFVGGTVVVSLPGYSFAAHQPAVIVATALLIALCSLNCVAIAAWERDIDLSQGKHSIATGRPAVEKHARVWLVFLTLVCLTFAWLGLLSYALGLCIELSAISLLLLQFFPVPADERTALADLAMLSPFLLFLLGRAQ